MAHAQRLPEQDRRFIAGVCNINFTSFYEESIGDKEGFRSELKDSMKKDSMKGYTNSLASVSDVVLFIHENMGDDSSLFVKKVGAALARLSPADRQNPSKLFKAWVRAVQPIAAPSTPAAKPPQQGPSC